MSSFIVKPSQKISGEVLVPGDKSISHRSIMFGSLANGITYIKGFLQGEDSLSTLNAFKNMGVDISRNQDEVVIKGVGIHGLKPAKSAIDLGNSGTSMRLMLGILSAQNFNSTLIGDASLSQRPMNRVVKPLAQMGASIQTQVGGKPPLVISGRQLLHGIFYKMPIASAQVKSCLLLAGLYAEGKTTIIEPAHSRNHTEQMLRSFGYMVETSHNQISLMGGGELNPSNITVPADISSAAFFMVAACIAKEADICLKSVNINPTRTGVIDILKLMDANLTIENTQEISGELLADIIVKSSTLKGIEIPQNLVPLAIDEFPAIFIAASMAEGQTVLRGAKELRVKESDRIAVMAEGLVKLGIDCEVLYDGIIINGQEAFISSGQAIKSYHDHRISMAFSLIGLRCQTDIQINGCKNVATSFPSFIELANQIGMDIQQINNHARNS